MTDDFPESIASELDSGMLESLPPLPPDPQKAAGPLRNFWQPNSQNRAGSFPGKIPAVCSFLGGRPKLGKSWFMQQVSYT